MSNDIKYDLSSNMKSAISIGYASVEDLPSWMQLVELVRWNFPGLETEELLEGYKNTVIKNINRNSAICAKANKQVVGILLFSQKHNMLCCMAVHPEYRRRHIAEAMILQMLKQLDRSRDIVVDTFRSEDPKGEAPRALYKKLGFVEGEEIIWQEGSGQVEYPEQRFILKAEPNIQGN